MAAFFMAAMFVAATFTAAAQEDPATTSDGSAQSGVAPNTDRSDGAPNCEQDALDALSSPDLASNSPQDNAKLLSQFVKCGGTIASLPQASFETLLREGVIELDIVGSGSVACPRGDKTHCSAVSAF